MKIIDYSETHYLKNCKYCGECIDTLDRYITICYQCKLNIEAQHQDDLHPLHPDKNNEEFTHVGVVKYIDILHLTNYF